MQLYTGEVIVLSFGSSTETVHTISVTFSWMKNEVVGGVEDILGSLWQFLQSSDKENL